MEALKKLFGLGPGVNFSELVKNGAQIIDVRTKGEYAGGHIRNSVNIPLDQLEQQVSRIRKDKVVITCCASGGRSGSARALLQAKGFEVHNGGGWMSLQKKLG